MALERREFLKLSAATGAGFGLAAVGAAAAPAVAPAPRPLRLLILGGTGFTGPFQVAYAVARGHEVTVFNRGRSEASVPPGVQSLRGDRATGDLDALRGGRWDAVIDNPTTLPYWVRDAAEVLAGYTGRYLFISTVSVYDFAGLSIIDESSPVLEYRDGDPLDIRPDTYAPAIRPTASPTGRCASPAVAISWRPATVGIRCRSSMRATLQNGRCGWPRAARRGRITPPGRARG